MSRTPYPTDLTDSPWRLIEPYVPRPKPGGRPACYTRREIVNAILYQTRNGCVWRALPQDLPPYRIAFHYFRLWQADGTWDQNGRKRFVAVDTLGLVWALLVVPARVQDRVGGIALVEKLRSAVKRIKIVWGDMHFDTALRHAWVSWGWLGVVVKKLVGQVGFVVQKKRWIVERTFGWLNRYRRLSKDYERTTASSEAFIKVAMIHLMVRRLRQ